MRRATGFLVSACLLLASGWVVASPPAGAAVITPAGSFASATNGIAVAPDGTLWVAEEFAQSVAKVSPSGAVLAHVPVGGNPSDVSVGPNGTVWVTVPSLNKVVKIVAATAVPTDVSTTSLAPCGPVAVAAGTDGYMYLSFPSCGMLGRIAVAGGPSASVSGRGTVFDLAVSGGQLFAPDFDTDVVRRMSLGSAFTVTSTTSVTGGGGPEGIAVAGSSVYVSLLNTGGIARFPVGQANGSAIALSGTSGLIAPFGITPNASGGVIVAGKTSHNYAYVDAAGTVTLNPLPADTEPFQAVTAANGDVWLTDQQHPQILRVVDDAPTGSLSPPKARTGSTAGAAFTVDPRGNDTSWRVEFGKNTAYGKAVTGTVGGTAGQVAKTAILTRLKAGKTYHLRLVVTNLRGTVTGPDVTFKMPKVAKGQPTFRSKVSKAGTTLTSVKVAKLVAGESVTVSCGGAKGCPFKKKKLKNVKKGTLDLTGLFRGTVLKPGVTVVVTISAKKVASSTTTLVVQDGRSPQIS